MINDPIIEMLKAIIYGIVEGVTEWLPISSTGHMIILSAVPGFNLEQTYGTAFWNFFLVIIQLGAILAVCFKFFKQLNVLSIKNTREEKKEKWKMWAKILIGCIPAGIIGILMEKFLPENANKALNSVLVVSIALILYGLIFIGLERYNKYKYKKHVNSLNFGKEKEVVYPYKYPTATKFSYLTALYIGLFQLLALIPGTSRSGVTIVSAMLLGASRTAAAEFSFYLSIPIMIGASLVRAYSFVKSGTALTSNMMIYLIFGILTAFLISVVVINTLMKWVKKHTFEGFGYYRIAAGILLLGLFLGHVIQ